jgi:hypothetical protein
MITTQMGLTVAITGSGSRSRFKLADIGTINGNEVPDDMCEISGVAFVQIHRIGEFTANKSSRYVLYLRGAGEHVGRCEVIDCTNINGDEVRGGLYIQRFGWTEVVCSQEPGAITIQEAGAIVCALTRTSGRIANFSEFKDSGDKGRGFYSYGLGTSGANIRIENIDLVEGGLRGMQLYCDGSIEIHNVKEIKGEKSDSDAQGLEFDGAGTLTITGGSQDTVITSKDNDSDAIRLHSGIHSLNRVATEASKGSIIILNTHKTAFYDCKLKGTVDVEDSTVQFFNSETTGGYDCRNAVVEWYLCELDIGADPGDPATFEASNSSLKLSKCTISGSEDWGTDNTAILFVKVDASGYSGEFEPSDCGITALNTDFGNDFDPTPTTGMILAKCSVTGAASLAGATISAVSSFDSTATVPSGCSLISAKDTYQALTGSANAAMLLNGSTVSGALTLGTDNAFIGNHFSASSSLTLGASTGTILNHGSITGNLTVSSGAAAFLSMTDVSGNLSVSGSAMGVEVSASSIPLAGSAIFSGADVAPTGAGQGIVVTGDNITTYMPTKDGQNDLRTGIFMDTQMIHMWNQYGHTGFTGTGTTLALGASATGTMNAPQWTADADGQSRAGLYIIDLAAAIHHNLPGIIE